MLFGIGDDELRAALRDAHDQAVLDALGYMERAAAVTRRGPGGVHAIAGNGFVAAAFRHRTSRAGDPQLHTHVLVANLTLGVDGQWSTLDGRRIYAHAKTAGYLYEARLRALLTRELGVEWGPVRNGIADIDGVRAGPCCGRSAGAAPTSRPSSSGAARAAPRLPRSRRLQTRRAKDYRVTPERLVPEWRERAAQLGLTREVIGGLGGRVRVAALTPESVEEIAAWLAGPTGLTEKRSTFTRRDVLQALCEALPASASLRATDVERLADEFLRSPLAVPLVAGERRDVLELARRPRDRHRRRGADLLDAGAARARARDPRVRRRRAAARARRSRGRRRSSVRSRVGRRSSTSSARWCGGSRSTATASHSSSGRRGRARRSRSARRARRGRRAAAGCTAPRSRAARRASSRRAPASRARASRLCSSALERHPLSTLPRRSVLVVDEAGMLPTRELAQLVERVRGLDVKLVLVGDHRQLAAIGPGGAFRGAAWIGSR